ncbi:hypothetical protein Tco_0719318 [Tanacetum coccineum]
MKSMNRNCLTETEEKQLLTSYTPTYDPEPVNGYLKIEERTSSNTNRANQDNSPRINRGTGYDNQRAVNVARAREKGSAKVWDAEQAGLEGCTDDESERTGMESTLFVHGTDSEVTTIQLQFWPIFDDEPMHKDDQDETDNLDQERDLLASLIQKLKCEIDDSKNRNKILESSNKE